MLWNLEFKSTPQIGYLPSLQKNTIKNPTPSSRSCFIDCKMKNREYNWENIEIQLGGEKIEGITSIKISQSEQKEYSNEYQGTFVPFSVIRYDLIEAIKKGINSHPQRVVENLGMTIIGYRGEPVGDCVIMEVQNLPKELPSYINKL